MSTSSTHETLDQLLSQYRGSQVESEGRFTLDPSRARELLGRFRLRHPDEYILHLISFLIGAGAEAIDIDFSGSSIIHLTSIGGNVDEETLRNPFSVLARSATEPHIGEIGIGLNAFLSDSNRLLEMSHNGFTGTYQNNDSHAIKTPDISGIRICCHRDTKDKVGLEEALIRQNFRWSPVPITMGGEDITEPVDLEPSVFELHLDNARYPLRLAGHPPHRITKSMKAGFSALLRIGGSRGHLRILRLGRSFEKPSPWSFHIATLPVDIVINTDRFKTDLSHQEIIEDQLYENLLKSLKVHMLNAFEFLISQDSPLLRTDEVIRRLVEYLFESGRPELALDLQTRRCRRFAQVPNTLAKGVAIFRLGLIQQSLMMPEGTTNHRYGSSLLGSLNDETSSRAYSEKIRARMIFAPDEPELSTLVVWLAQVRGDEAQEPCWRWLSRHEKDPESRVDACIKLVEVLLEKGATGAAKVELEAAKEHIAGAPNLPSPEIREKLLELQAELALKTGRLEQSIQHLEELLAAQTQRFGRGSARLGLTLKRLALLFDESGDGKKARQMRKWSRSLK